MNYFQSYTFKQIITMHPVQEYDAKKYHQILEPDFPEFLNKYIQLPLLQRLSGIGLLCGSDWTKLFNNRFYYSRLDHSIGVALITWHFTHNKAQTIAGLLHDISTPVFSHVSDFRKGDALTQTATEEPTQALIRGDRELLKLLEEDGLTVAQVEDYHIYPVADNEIPQLSADRLEYMYPSGMALEGSWTLEQVAATYNDLEVLTNEKGEPELGFNTLELAELYCQKFCMTGHILQMNEDKITLQLLGQIMNKAVEEQVLQEDDFMTLSETQILTKLEASTASEKLMQLYRTFRNMTEILHTDAPLPAEDYFCISLKVKQRYINPLVKTKNGVLRLKEASNSASKIISDFLDYNDTPWGCVKLYK